jgi:hypothetical protein
MATSVFQLRYVMLGRAMPVYRTTYTSIEHAVNVAAGIIEHFEMPKMWVGRPSATTIAFQVIDASGEVVYTVSRM